MVKKIKKYAHVFNSVVNQASELKKLEGFSPYSKIVSEAFLKVKKGEYTQEETAIFRKLDEYRARLLASDEIVTYEIFGSDLQRTVAEIARIGASPQVWCKLYYFLTTLSGAKNVLEIGTNLGVSGQYFIEGLKDGDGSKFITLEGVPKLCEIASERFSSLAKRDGQFEVIQGLYDDTLHSVLDSGIEFDLVFIDGNHKYEPTVKYFNLLKNNYRDHAIILFDDIYISEEMERAWKEVKKDPGVVCSIDLFKLGIVVYEKGGGQGEPISADLFLSVR
ncbi:MAG: class I SAM-dependent methyltransferase [Lewinellaceae bacterium]|nr:class I SAM-dependent methyltransferase [Phaeodactylibacter sp.]MCB9036187.1 class I SAM-dependent methyltransferase [Lewinellaceae bacterium]